MAGKAWTSCRRSKRVSRSTRRERIVQREHDPGWRDRFLSRTEELEEILDRDDIADFRLDNDGRPARAVATEMLEKAGWISREE